MKCKRLCAWLLSLVMMFSLLPVSAAAAGTDVGSKAYDEIRIYLDAETKTDFDNLEGTLTKQVRIISPEYSGGDTLCFHNMTLRSKGSFHRHANKIKSDHLHQRWKIVE